MSGFEGLTRNREVLDCALGLCTVECISRNANFAHGVMFNAVFNVFSHISRIAFKVAYVASKRCQKRKNAHKF